MLVSTTIFRNNERKVELRSEASSMKGMSECCLAISYRAS